MKTVVVDVGGGLRGIYAAIAMRLSHGLLPRPARLAQAISSSRTLSVGLRRPIAFEWTGPF